jgi:hypothetical protein
VCHLFQPRQFKEDGQMHLFLRTGSLCRESDYVARDLPSISRYPALRTREIPRLLPRKLMVSGRFRRRDRSGLCRNALCYWFLARFLNMSKLQPNSRSKI